MSVFETLNGVNVNQNKDKKNGLDYLSWAWAWTEVKKRYPDAQSIVFENDNGWPYFTDGKTCWVKTGVTINGLMHVEYLPVMDFRNNSIPLEKVTSTDVNKAIQRCITKAIARHGLGLYIYAGEDLPEDASETSPQPQEAPKTEKAVNVSPNTITDKEAAILEAMCQRANVNTDKLKERYGVSDFTKLSSEQYTALVTQINGALQSKGQ